LMWLVAAARLPSRWKWGVIALCFTVWFVTNFTKGVHEDEEIERALDILEMLLDYRADVDGVSDKIRRFLLEHVLFSKGGKRL
jgi:hypothetical protein